MRISWLLTVLLPGIAAAQVTFSQGDWPGTTLQFDARFEPPARNDGGMIGSVMTGKDWQHRIISDPRQKRYFGYDFRVDAHDGTYQVRIQPLNLTPEEMRAIRLEDTWTKLSLPQYPAIPAARVGDTVALDVLADTVTGRKVVDSLSFIRSTTEGPGPRDFALSDAELEVVSPRIRINGSLVGGSTGSRGGLSGPNLWFYVPGHGRYVMSLVPKQQYGFGNPERAGQVTGSVITFQGGGVEYQVESDRRIAPGTGLYNVYVSHNAVWRPGARDAKEPYLWGAY